MLGLEAQIALDEYENPCGLSTCFHPNLVNVLGHQVELFARICGVNVSPQFLK